MNIGIYGGTFDPPHIGHVTAARAAMEVLGLDKLVLVPDAQPPHKALPEGGAAPRQRYDMAVLATAALGKRAEVSDMELRRSGVSYTADTLAALREQYPDDTLYLLMGSDMFLSLHNWRRPEVIMAMAHIAPFSREAEDESAAFAAQSARLEREFGAQVTVVPNPQVVELSSTEVRAALAQGGGEDLLPPPVWGYIRREHLYGTHTDLTHLTPEELRPIALSYLKPKRMPHVLGTEQEAVRLAERYGADVTVIPNPQGVELSSTEVRQVLAQGGGADLLPPAVYGYVLRERLYSTKKTLTGLTPDELRPIALSYLKPKRMPHVLGTEQEAVRLARRYGGDEIQARIAALLHDCTKKLDMPEQLALCAQYGIELDELEQKALKLLHSKTGAAIARDVFGVEDAVYDAIWYHTTGKPDMTLLEKIIYLADYIEPSRDFDGVDTLRQAVYEDLDHGLLMGLSMTIQEMEEMGNPVHHLTRDARDYLLKRGIR